MLEVSSVLALWRQNEEVGFSEDIASQPDLILAVPCLSWLLFHVTNFMIS